MEVELKKEDRELLKSVIEGLKTPVQTSTTQNPSETSTTKAGHESIEDLMNCKDCYPKAKAIVIEREFKDADYECEECGLPVKGEQSAKQDWECPSCKHKYAKRKD